MTQEARPPPVARQGGKLHRKFSPVGYFNANDPKHRDGVKHATVKPSKRMPVREAQHKFDPKQGIPKPDAPKLPKAEPKFEQPKAKREVTKPFPTDAK